MSKRKLRLGLSAEKRELFELMRRQQGLGGTGIEPIPRRAPGPTAPLSFAQERLWFLDQLEPGQVFYNELEAVELEGDLDVAALERSLLEVGRRQEGLRTTFRNEDGTPVQVIHEDLAPALDVFDASGAGPGALAEHVEAELSTPFDLAAGPLWRVRLIRLAPTRHALLLTMHHIVSDGWSLGVLIKEVIGLYGAHLAGAPPPLAELPIQYPDFAVWQRAKLEGAALERHLDYWREQLLGLPPLELPTDRPRPAVQRYHGDCIHFELAPELTRAVDELCRREEATPFMVLLAAYAAVLGRLSGQRDFAIGTAIANRPHPQTADLIGFFVNTLVMRARLGGEPSFVELVRRMRKTAVDAYSHQELPFERLVEDLQPERTLARAALFQVFFVMQSMHIPPMELPGVTVRRLELPRRSVKFDLEMHLQPVGEGAARALRGKLEYCTDLFDEATARRLVDHFRTLLAAALADPDAPIARLRMLADEELAELDRLNATDHEPDNRETAVDMLLAQARRTPERIAAVGAGIELSYAELERRSRRLAAALVRRGVGRGDRVGLMMPRTPAMLVAVLGVLRAGACYVPLDPEFPAGRLAIMLADSAASLVLAAAELHAHEAARGEVPLVDPETLIAAGDDEDGDASPLVPEDLAYILYTSGSTGRPKGVQVHHGGLASLLRSLQRRPGLGEADTWVAVTTWSFDIAAVELLLPPSVGARIVVASESETHDGAELGALLTGTGATIMQATPSTWRMLLDAGWKPSRPFVAISTGEALPPGLARELKSCVTRLYNLYGPTETTVFSTIEEIPDHVATVSIGRPVDNTQLWITDAHLERTPIGVVGELYIGGAGVAQGYIGRPDLTAERFVPAIGSREPGARMYRTGDLARALPDGRIDFLGRIDHQVKVRGFRIELGEVEAALASHPAVAESVVVPQPDSSGSQRLVGYVVPRRATEDPGEHAAREHVDEWRAVWTEAYRKLEGDDPTFDISGWRNSYDGEPIPAPEMRAWVDATIERILALGPRRVLEIGCGTGLLLFRVAPHVERYHGTDLSPVVIERLRRTLRDRPELRHVVVEHRSAEDFDGLPGDFDLVILNSVAQYMPSLAYFAGVLDQAIAATAGGAIFLGDLRSLPLLEALHASIALFQAPGSLSKANLRWRARRQMVQERELVFDPRLFEQLPERDPRVASVSLQLKRGRYRNELTKFRYDVTVRVGSAPAESAPPPAERSWRELGSIEALERWLGDAAIEHASVTGVPNPRVAEEMRLASLLRTDSDHTVESLRKACAAAPGSSPDPEDFWELGARLGRHVEVRPGGARAPFAFEVRIAPAPPAAALAPPPARSGALELPAELANAPLAKAPGAELLVELRAHLEARLAPYMVPSPIIVLDELPRTPNNKIARRALPEPEVLLGLRRTVVEPRGPVEEALAELFAELLGVERVSADDNFFELGGHSLLATRLVARVNKTFGVPFAVRQVFETPRLSELARSLDRALSAQGRGGTAIEPVPRTGELVLSFVQERLWFLQQLEPDSPSYNLPIALRLEGRLHTEALELALAQVIARHEVLRTTYPAREGRPVPQIHPHPTALLAHRDLSSLPPGERARELERLAAGEAERPFDLAEGPVLRAELVRLAEQEHVLLLTMHHIAADAWSIGIVVRELGALYTACLEDRDDPLGPLPVQYVDYAAWQRRRADGGELAPQLAYWKRQLAGAPVLDLPTDRPRPRYQSFAGGRAVHQLDAKLVAALRAVAKDEGATLFMTLMAGFAALLSRYSGQHDVSIGTPYAGRTQLETEAIVGCFFNTLVFRVDLHGAPDFRELVRRVRGLALGAYANQDVPIERLVDELTVERDLSRTPLFQAVFALHNAPRPEVELPDLRLTLLETVGEVWFSDADLTADCWENKNGIEISCIYSAALFDPTTIQRLLGHFETLLRSASHAPDRPIAELELAGPEERAALVERVNATARPLQDDACVHRRILETAGRQRDAVAVKDPHRELSYGELAARTRGLAAALRRRGVGRGSFVGLFFERACELSVAQLATLEAGAAYVPLDPDYPVERLRFMASDARPALVLTVEALAPRARELGAEVLCVEDAPAEAHALPRDAAGLEDAIYLLYTSGTTGRPKGALNLHRALKNRLEWMQRRYRLSPADRVLHKTPISFDVSGWELLWPLMEGARLVMAPPGAHRDPHELSQVIEREGVSVVHFVPSMLRAFLDALEPGACPSLRLIVASGEALGADVARGVRAAFGGKVQLANLYGPTEAAIDVSYHDTSDSDGAVIPIGKPIDNTRLYVLDPLLHPQARGVPGELYIGGMGLAAGYFGRPDLTAERFVPDPHAVETGSRLYRTGDVARWLPSLELEFLGRTDHQIKLRGQRIELLEIDAALRNHPAVSDAVTLARPLEAGGERSLVSFVVASEGGSIDVAALKDHLRRELPEYMVPVVIEALAELPLSPSGKVDRASLHARQVSLERIAGEHVGPRDPVEELVAGIVGEVLGLERVGVLDSFFELGGHSLLATRVVARVEDALGVRIPLRELFEAPTVAGLAAALRRRQPDGDLDGVAQVLLEMAQMSDDQVARLLEEPP